MIISCLSMKIGIITFHAAFNYGSMLQAYALQHYLLGLGHTVEIINYRSLAQKALYCHVLDVSHVRNVRNLGVRLLFSPCSIKGLIRKWELFDAFMSNHMILTEEYNTLESLKALASEYDIVITGSDQIWNTTAHDFSEAYFASFVSDKTRKVAYAPSMGPTPENQDVEYLKKLLQDYYAISVREERTKLFLEQNGIASQVKIVLDPTMLLGQEDYKSLISSKPLVEGRYIYYYTPGFKPRHEFLKVADMLGEQLGMDVVCDYPYISCKQYKHLKCYSEVGPSEFLNLLKNADLVCGASFHLMVFSILFQKPFYCLNGDVDSRMNNLMKMFHLEDRIWSVTAPPLSVLDNCSREIDYSKIFPELQKKREQSVKFLYEALH